MPERYVLTAMLPCAISNLNRFVKCVWRWRQFMDVFLTVCQNCFCVSDQGNLQGPKGLKAKRSREYFEVKHLGVEKKKRGRKRKSEYLLPGDPNSVVARPLVENGIPIVGASFSVVQGQKISSSTAATIAPVQNGTVVTQTPGAPIVIPQGVSPGVSTPPTTVGNVAFQVPANITVPHPSTSVKTVPMLAPQGKLPMAHPHRSPVPINALPGGKPVMKEVIIVFSHYILHRDITD